MSWNPAPTAARGGWLALCPAASAMLSDIDRLPCRSGDADAALALCLHLRGRVARRLRVEPAPTLGLVLRATGRDVHVAAAGGQHGLDARGLAFIDPRRQHGAAAAHAFGVDVGVFLAHARAGERAEQATGRGADAGRVAEAVGRANAHAKASADFLKGMQVAPIVTLAMELLNTVRAEADGAAATLTAHIETTPAAILSLPFLSDADVAEEDEEVAHPRLRRGAEKPAVEE